MASKPRAKASAGAGKGKTGGRSVRPKTSAGVPLMPVVAGVILGLLTIALIATIVYLQRPQATTNPTVSGIPCDHLEHTQVHYHAGLQIMYHGTVTNLPGNLGIQLDSTGSNVNCYYWLHVHTTAKNVIHIESPASQIFTLGQFFDVWNSWSQSNGHGAQRLDAMHVSTFTLAPEDKIVVYIDLGDGKGAQPFTGDPRTIQLKSHEVITIEIEPPDANPPPSFSFPSGL